MKSAAIISLLASVTLSGCQTSFDETSYDPLVTDVVFTSNADLTQRTLSGSIEAQWTESIEPTIQELCIQCHQGEDSSLSYGSYPKENLYETLLSVKRHEGLSMNEGTHGELTDTQQQAFIKFEQNAHLYWPWAEELGRLELQARRTFVEQVEHKVIQPVCSLCHRVSDGEEANLNLGLSFYPKEIADSQLLNADFSLSYLLLYQDAYLLGDKATSQIYHGGGLSIPRDSEFSQALYEHADIVQDILLKLEQTPF